MKAYTIYICPECGATFTEAYPSHGKRGIYPIGRRPQCDQELEAIEVIPRTLADELAEALNEALIDIGAKGVDDPTAMKGSRIGREALAKYREAVGK